MLRRACVSVVILALQGCAGASRARQVPRDTSAPSSPAPSSDVPSISPEATYHYLRARVMLDQGDAPGADAALREAMLFHPDSALLHALLSEALLRQGRVNDAVTEADRALQIEPASVEGHAARAHALWEAGRYGQAEESLRVVVTRDAKPKDAERLAELLVGRGDIAAAERLGAQLATRASDDDEALTLVARVCLKHGQWECAVTQLEGAARVAPASFIVCAMRADLAEQQARFQDAAGIRETCAALEPDDDEAHLSLVRSQALAGNITGARQAAATMMARAPDEPGVTARVLDALLEGHAPDEVLRIMELRPRRPGLEPELELRQGQALSTLGRCVEAEAVLSRVGLQTAVGPQAAHLAASCQLRRRAPVDALKTLDVALAAHPDATPLQAVRCAALKMAGHAADAARVAASLRGVGGPAAELVRVRAVCLAEAGDVAGAVKVISEPLAVAPDDAAALLALAEIQWLAGRRIDAGRTARAAVAAHPESAEAQNFLAYALLVGGGDPQEALLLSQRAAARMPASAAVADTLGVAELATGKPARAVNTLLRAVALEPHEPEIWLHLGDAHLAAGQKPRAQQAWARGLMLLPLDEDVEKALRARMAGS